MCEIVAVKVVKKSFLAKIGHMEAKLFRSLPKVECLASGHSSASTYLSKLEIVDKNILAYVSIETITIKNGDNRG